MDGQSVYLVVWSKNSDLVLETYGMGASCIRFERNFFVLGGGVILLQFRFSGALKGALDMVASENKICGNLLRYLVVKKVELRKDEYFGMLVYNDILRCQQTTIFRDTNAPSVEWYGVPLCAQRRSSLIRTK
ncbi:unnamed protein product [Sphenostylis stenocarpa]|uniref:Uncharacterized protein n=1 Tax=Sphenostylis stenocarpa TaxID=92480 RepID=A0AA86RRT2_9FABA|nr:unnamed protein product [Sphenostylis stenocarpa]